MNSGYMKINCLNTNPIQEVTGNTIVVKLLSHFLRHFSAVAVGTFWYDNNRHDYN